MPTGREIIREIDRYPLNSHARDEALSRQLGGVRQLIDWYIEQKACSDHEMNHVKFCAASDRMSVDMALPHEIRDQKNLSKTITSIHNAINQVEYAILVEHSSIIEHRKDCLSEAVALQTSLGEVAKLHTIVNGDWTTATAREEDEYHDHFSRCESQLDDLKQTARDADRDMGENVRRAEYNIDGIREVVTDTLRRGAPHYDLDTSWWHVTGQSTSQYVH